MKLWKFKSILLSLSVVCAAQMLAATNTGSNQALQQMVQNIVDQKTQNLQDEVLGLRSQVKSLKTQLSAAKQIQNNRSNGFRNNGNGHNRSFINLYLFPQPLLRTTVQGTAAKDVIKLPTITQSQQRTVLSGVYLGGTPVFTSPYLGLNSSYDGSDLIVNASKINLDVRILRQSAALYKSLMQQGYVIPKHPIVELSGKIEGQASYDHQSGGDGHADATLASTEVDTLAQIDQSVTGYIAFEYDNSETSPIRTSNSRIYLDRGFITVGNFNKSPFYFSIGQLYVPFGQFTSYMLSSTVPKNIGRIQNRAIVFGMQPMDNNGLFASVYAFRGNTRVNRRRAGGADIGLVGKSGQNDGQISFSVTSNLAESQGMQATGQNDEPWQGFGSNIAGDPPTGFGSEFLQHGVPAFDIQGQWNVGQLSLLAEYVGSFRAYSARDLSFNGRGARPKAFHVELIHHYQWLGRPGTYGFGYDYSDQALALLQPRDRFLWVINYSYWRNTIESIEIRQDINYSSSDLATGLITGPGGAIIPSAPFGFAHKTDTLITGQIGVYF